MTDESDILMILANAENCNIQTTQVSDVKSAIELPSVELREEMLTTLINQDALNPYREYGGLVLGETNSVIGWAKPGEEFQLNGQASINPYDLEDRDMFMREDCSVKWRFHSHPSGIRTQGEKYSAIEQTPNECDRRNMESGPTTSGYAFQFGMSSHMVNIYNAQGTKASISFETFKMIGR